MTILWCSSTLLLRLQITACLLLWGSIATTVAVDVRVSRRHAKGGPDAGTELARQQRPQLLYRRLVKAEDGGGGGSSNNNNNDKNNDKDENKTTNVFGKNLAPAAKDDNGSTAPMMTPSVTTSSVPTMAPTILSSLPSPEPTTIQNTPSPIADSSGTFAPVVVTTTTSPSTATPVAKMVHNSDNATATTAPNSAPSTRNNINTTTIAIETASSTSSDDNNAAVSTTTAAPTDNMSTMVVWMTIVVGVSVSVIGSLLLFMGKHRALQASKQQRRQQQARIRKAATESSPPEESFTRERSIPCHSSHNGSDDGSMARTGLL